MPFLEKAKEALLSRAVESCIASITVLLAWGVSEIYPSLLSAIEAEKIVVLAALSPVGLGALSLLVVYGRWRRSSRKLGLLALMCVFVLTPQAWAGIIEGSISPVSLFGTLSQGQTQCPEKGCGPVAAVNSFTFLQNKYPQVYDQRLVSTSLNAVQVANLLLGDQ